MAKTEQRALVVLTTVGSEEQAVQIARGLVDRRLAACVNILGGGSCSVYRWKGEIVEEEERVLVIKTSEPRFEALRQAIHELHSYEVPEVLALPVAAGDAKYLEWLHASVKE